MAKVEIIDSLKHEVFKRFKGESAKVFKFMRSLKENPRKGRLVGQIMGISIKEIKYKGFRFYFIVNSGELRILSQEKLQNLLIRFVRMSDKKSQQKTINEIKIILRSLGDEGF